MIFFFNSIVVVPVSLLTLLLVSQTFFGATVIIFYANKVQTKEKHRDGYLNALMQVLCVVWVRTALRLKCHLFVSSVRHIWRFTVGLYRFLKLNFQLTTNQSFEYHPQRDLSWNSLFHQLEVRIWSHLENEVLLYIKILRYMLLFYIS